jgi:hypothetical protein
LVIEMEEVAHRIEQTEMVDYICNKRRGLIRASRLGNVKSADLYP